MYRYFLENVEWESDDVNFLSLIMLDIDSFKGINDEYGHLEGDRTLKLIADVLQNSFRGTDIVIRYAGDEFSILLPNTGREEAIKLAEKARQDLEQETFEYGTEKDKKNITLSAGISVFPEDARTADNLLDKADKALYFSKLKGRNTVSDSTELKHEHKSSAGVFSHKLYQGNQDQIEGIEDQDMKPGNLAVGKVE
jgi:diguanylate cyclase (GGDEF)-like protein